MVRTLRKCYDAYTLCAPFTRENSAVHVVRGHRRPVVKKPVNLSIDAELLNAARGSNINLSATLERALHDELRKSRRERWLAENRSGIMAYNQQVAVHGAFADTLRSF